MEESPEYSQEKTLQAIRNAFQNLPVPSADEIGDDYGRVLRGPNQWLSSYFHNVFWWDVEPIAYFFMDLSLRMAPQGYRYYLPGLLSIAVRDEHAQNTIDVLTSLGYGVKELLNSPPKFECIQSLSKHELETIIYSLHTLARIWIKNEDCSTARDCVCTRRALSLILQRNLP